MLQLSPSRVDSGFEFDAVMVQCGGAGGSFLPVTLVLLLELCSPRAPAPEGELRALQYHKPAANRPGWLLKPSGLEMLYTHGQRSLHTVCTVS